MGLPENYGEVEYDEEGNIVTYEGIPIAQYQIPLLYRALPPHKRKVVQSIFYCYALDEMDELLDSDAPPMDAFNEVAHMIIEKVKRVPSTQTNEPRVPEAAKPDNMPKKRRPRNS